MRLRLRRRRGLRLRPLHRVAGRRPRSGLGRPGFRGDVGEMRLGGQVFELRFGREVAQLRFRREVGELRLRRKFSGFRREFRRLRFGGQVPRLRPVGRRSLLRGVGRRRGLLENLWREVGLVHRRVDGVDLPQCHWREKQSRLMKRASIQQPASR